MNGVQTRLKCKPNVKRCKRFVFAAHSPLLHPNTLKTKAIIHFQTDHILTRFVFPPLYTGALIFRGTEALLNYIEACYEKNGSLDNIAQSYWTQIRKRSHVDTDYNKTIAATDMAKEALNDWGAYSAGKLIDPTLYNIRRERRCELMAEGLRYMDLMRWRAMDQMISTPYHIEGFKLWGSMQHWYDNEDGTSQLVYGMDNPKANVSDPAISPYLRPYEKNNNNLAKDGYRWAMAHYLEPYRIQDMDITSGGGSIENSPIYQNPYWPTEPNMPPLK